MTIKKTLLCVAVAGLAFSACQNQHADLATKGGGTPFNYDSLSYAKAKQYVTNYEKQALNMDTTYVENGKSVVTKKSNSRSIWFSADRLQAMLDKIKSEGGDGIRFYYATYDTSYNKAIGVAIPPKMYWGYNTLVMVSTKDSTNQANEKFHRDYFTSKPQGSDKPVLGFIVGGPPENRGELCPPPKKCNEIGALLIP